MCSSEASQGLGGTANEAVTQDPRVLCASTMRGTKLLVAAGLACLIVVVFLPVLGFEFVDYDVTGQVVQNPWIRGLTWENVSHIFTSRCVTSYYPVRTLSFALDYQIWGLWAGGFKLTNGLIHLANTLLVFWLMLRLFAESDAGDSLRPIPTRYGILAAAFCAGVFAVHPVVVEPVVWVAGREELLMTLGALGCFHLHMTARHLDRVVGRGVRAAVLDILAVLCCGAACLSNAVGAVIPALITAWDVLMLKRPKAWRIVRGTAALWVISAVTIVLKRIGDRGVAVAEPGFFSSERLILVPKVYWLNVKSLIWPTGLAPCRKRLEPETFLDPEFILGVALIVLSGLVIWWLRRRKLALFGVLWFGIALAPGSQIMAHHIHQADRFLYLPLVGLLAAASLGLRSLEKHLTRRGTEIESSAAPEAARHGRGRGLATVFSSALRIGVPAVALWCLLLLSILAAGQVQTWRNPVSMWENCVRVDPDNALAHYALGNALAQRGQYDEAMRHRQAQLALDFNNPEGMRFAALVAIKGTETAPPNYPLAVQLARRACELTRWDNPRHLRVLAIAYSSLAQSLVDKHELQRAIQNYRTALALDPDCQEALVQLAVVLATCNDNRFRNPREAVELAERATRSANQSDANMFVILATVYAEAWEFDKAIAAIEQAIQLTQSTGQTELMEALRGRLETYKKRIPPESLR